MGARLLEPARPALSGTPAEVAERVAGFGEAGADTYILMPPANDRRTVELFVDEVMDSVA